VRRYFTPYNAEDEVFSNIILWYMRTAQDPKNIMAIDIETPKTGKGGERQIACVSFAFSANESLVLPWSRLEFAV
jgi:hypothetical protein